MRDLSQRHLLHLFESGAILRGKRHTQCATWDHDRWDYVGITVVFPSIWKDNHNGKLIMVRSEFRCSLDDKYMLYYGKGHSSELTLVIVLSIYVYNSLVTFIQKC
jgi:hypothetical protein